MPTNEDTPTLNEAIANEQDQYAADERAEPLDDRPYYLACGCWSEQADHTCMIGNFRRPDYCHCGAPDDCYCNEDGQYDD